jgi:hypothetical protein
MTKIPKELSMDEILDRRRERELKPLRRGPREAELQAIRDKKYLHRYMVSLNPIDVKYARRLGGNNLSKGLRKIMSMVRATGPKVIDEFASGKLYQTLLYQMKALERRVAELEYIIAPVRRRTFDFPAESEIETPTFPNRETRINGEEKE